MRNLIVGEKYLAHEGEMVISELTTGHRCVVTFKEGGYWGPSRNVNGVVYGPSSSSKPLARIDGTWNEGISLQLDPKGSHLRVLWRAHDYPPHTHEYYGFTSFTMSLNEITPDISDYLPPTDSRLRPDQKAMEEGNIELADQEKARYVCPLISATESTERLCDRVEAAQRVRRKQREDQGEEWKPRWFEPAPGDTGDWIYTGGYWEARETKKWPPTDQLW